MKKIFKKIVVENMTKKEEDRSRIQWYMESYEYFINYFKDKKTLQREHIVFGIAMAYSWMPRIPQIREITDREINWVNNLRRKCDKDTFNKLKDEINGSTIGTSKFLHFIAPKKYPIWDTNVCFAVHGNDNANQPSRYFEYIEMCNALIDKGAVFKGVTYKDMKKEVKQYLKDEFGGVNKIENYDDLRIIDFYMWKKGKDEKEKQEQES
jgi:hypothetical protein